METRASAKSFDYRPNSDILMKNGQIPLILIQDQTMAFRRFILFLSLFVPCSGFAQPPYPAEITLCYGPWEPYEYREGLQTRGVNVERMEAAARSLGIRIRWQAFPWSRCVESARKGLVDGLMSLYHSEKREAYLFFPHENLNLDQSVFITYPGSKVRFDGSLDSLTGTDVVVAQANSYGKEFDKADNFRKIAVPSHENVALMVAFKRHRLGIGSRSFFEDFIREKKLFHQIEFLSPPYRIKTYVAFSRRKGPTHQKLAEDMGRALEAIKQTPAWDAIQKKYE